MSVDWCIIANKGARSSLTKEVAMSDVQVFPPALFDVQIFVDPTTKQVSGMFAFTFLGITVRHEGDWEPVLRSETNLDDISHHDIYSIDWTVDDIPNSEADLSVELEHDLVLAYDNETITLDMIKHFCTVIQIN